MNFSLISRGLEWSSRFLRGCQIFGFYGAWNVFVRSNRRIKSKNSKALSSVEINKSLKFYFRRGIDHSVLSHFYEPGYFIQSNNGPAIKRVLDAGANIGDETARFYLLYPEIEIVSIEAEKNNFEILNKNFASLDSVHTIYGAIWYESGKLRIKESLDGSTDSFSVETVNDENNSIIAYSVRDILELKNWDKIDIFKIDIEGAEEELFSFNAKEWITRVNCFIIETHDRYKPAITQKIFRALSEESFNTYICGENLVFIRSNLPWELKIIKGFPVELIAVNATT